MNPPSPPDSELRQLLDAVGLGLREYDHRADRLTWGSTPHVEIVGLDVNAGLNGVRGKWASYTRLLPLYGDRHQTGMAHLFPAEALARRVENHDFLAVLDTPREVSNQTGDAT